MGNVIKLSKTCQRISAINQSYIGMGILPSVRFFLPGSAHAGPRCCRMRQIRFFMHGLEDGVRIDVCIKVKKGIYMYAVDTAGRVTRRAEILLGSQIRAAEKSGRGAVGGQVAVSVVCSGPAC